jgi:CheY-like chemotaxis protein
MISHKILLVDDEEPILSSLKRLLLKEPYSVVTASSAMLALECLESEDFAILLTDHRMPRMSGMELLERVRNAYPDTVRIMLSGQADLNEVMEALEQGELSLFIKKPWDTPKLKFALLEAVSQYEHGKQLVSLLDLPNLEEAIMEHDRAWLMDCPFASETQIRLLSRIISQSPVPTLFVNTKQEIIFVNQASRLLFNSVSDLNKPDLASHHLIPEVQDELNTFIKSAEARRQSEIFSGTIELNRISSEDEQTLVSLSYYLSKPKETGEEEAELAMQL